MIAVWYAKYVFGNKMLYSVQPRHLHYTDVMPLLCHVWFGLRLGLVLGLELPSLESKPANNSEKTLRLMSGDDGNGWLLWQVPHAGADRHRLLTSDSSYSNAYWCRPAHSLSNMICRLTHRDAVWHITQIHPKNYFICNKWINKPVQLILY